MKRLWGVLLAAAILLSAQPAAAADRNTEIPPFSADCIAAKEARAVNAMLRVWDIEAGTLAEGASEELLQAAADKAAILPAGNVHKENLAIIEQVARAELTKPQLRLYGSNVRITFYCAGPCCCGAFASGYTASGTRATASRTVASGDLPFGTHILIDGQEYVVEDRGVGAQQIDIFVDTHAEADARGLYYREVYIVG